MHSRQIFPKQLARALLVRSWTKRSLLSCVKKHLKPAKKSRWVHQFLDQLLRAFPPERLRPSERELTEWIEAVLRFVEPKYRGKNYWIETLSEPAPKMRPGPGVPDDWGLPELTTTWQLAEWLGLTTGQLDWFARRFQRTTTGFNPRLHHYRHRWIPKASGKNRLLEIPKSRLKALQQDILREILNRIPPHPAACGYRPGRSLVDYLEPHTRQEVVLQCDLRHFFPSVTMPHIRAIFRWAGYPESVATSLSGLCTCITPREFLRNIPDESFKTSLRSKLQIAHLPQGAPTSPALSNLAVYRLDCRLTGLAKKFSARYTRYADDLLFSGPRSFERQLSAFRIWVTAIALDEGFDLNLQKSRVLPRGSRQQVCGVVINKKLNVPRRDYDVLKATLHNCVVHGPKSQNRAGITNFAEHLAGKIAYWKRFHPAKAEKLQRIYDQIVWSPETD